ncbi:hypothetical protein VNI00_013592 [Paramarasmius palmivorus]|uniref:Protein F37C4.5 n=1 Tax=Paramarasmius palmivorus TaxID=297713 RepID=A0AAW0BXV3_9AGAR
MSVELDNDKENLLSSDDAGSTKPAKTITLGAGKLVAVNVYPDSAEVSRSYSFLVQDGWNSIHISDLPATIDAESLRVAVKGPASVRNITVERGRETSTSSPHVASLQSKKQTIERQVERVKKTTGSLETYSGTLSVDHVQVDHVGEWLKAIRSAGKELDEESMKLEVQLKSVKEELEHELRRIGTSGPLFTATFSLFSEDMGDIEAQVTYVVSNSSWSPSYDIKVDTRSVNSPVTLIYKAIVKQDTGESWNDATITLRTLSPSACVNLPSIETWSVSLYIPVASPQPLNRKRRRESTGGTPARKAGTYGKRNAAYEDGSDEEEEEAEDGDDTEFAEAEQDDGNQEAVAENEDTAAPFTTQPSATFKLTEKVSIPSGDGVHTIIITELKSDAKLTWFCAPGGDNGDSRVHLKAQIRNGSEYTLLPSGVNVYADGSLVSKSTIPTVNPLETFECPLYLDPSIRVTCHPPVKNVSTTGFYNKSRSHSTTTRITVHNSKSIPVHNLRVLDRIPISDDARVAVKLTNPTLKRPIPGMDKPLAPVKVGEGILAQWSGADEAGVDARMLGKDGKFFWLCDVPAQGTISLVSQWEVLAPLDAEVVGL